MDEKTSLIKKITQLKDRLLNKDDIIDSSILRLYNELESQFKKTFSQVPFNFPSVNQPSCLEFAFRGPQSFDRRLNPILERLEYMISYFPNEIIEKNIMIQNVHIKNFYQKINQMNIDNSKKQIIIQNINQLDEELKKPIKNKQKIKKIITKLLMYDLPKEILIWLIKISLSSFL
jgi:hypothetical protein